MKKSARNSAHALKMAQGRPVVSKYASKGARHVYEGLSDAEWRRFHHEVSRLEPVR